jgi:hypothetical protein
MEGTMNSLAGFAHRTQILARFKRAMLIFWLPLVLAAVVPAVVTTVAYWLEKPEPASPMTAPPADPKSRPDPTVPSLPATPAERSTTPALSTDPLIANAVSGPIPPASALIGAQVIGDASEPVWHVEAVGTDIKGKTVSVFLRNDATRERATAPVHDFGWKWDPKRVNAPAMAYVVGSNAKNSWIWIKDNADPPFTPQ